MIKPNYFFIQFLFIVLFPFFLHAQKLDFGVTGAAGISFANVVGGSLTNSTTNDIDPGISYNVGFIVSATIANKLELGGGLNISRFSIKENNFTPLKFGTDIINAQNGIASESYLKYEYSSSLTFVSIPLYLRYSMQKIAFKAGVQTMFYSVGFSDIKFELNASGNIINSRESNEDIDKRLVKTNLGPTIGIEYKITDALWLRGDIFYGLRKIRNEAFSSDKQLGQATLGVNYYLTKTNN